MSWAGLVRQPRTCDAEPTKVPGSRAKSGHDEERMAHSRDRILSVQYPANQEIPMLAVKDQVRAAPSRVNPVAALRGFFHITDAWGATSEQARIILGAPAERT